MHGPSQIEKDSENNLYTSVISDVVYIFHELNFAKFGLVGKSLGDSAELFPFKYWALGICTDFDGDKLLGPEDIQQTLRLLTRGQLTAEESSQICGKVVDECDVDGDGRLSFIEFEHVITRAPDFLPTFHIRI